MAILNYQPKTANTREKIHKELDAYQKTLETMGFTVNRKEQIVNYEAAVSLSAEKGGVTLIASRFLTGGRDLSVTLKRDGVERTVSLVPYSFISALSIANSLQTLDC